MSFIRKFNGKTERSADPSPVVACYRCPEHGEFDTEVERDKRGEAPDVIACPITCPPCCRCEGRDERCPYTTGPCGDLATWVPSRIACHMPRVTAVRGKWEPPERKTFLDTRELAEGMDPDDFAAKRAAVWEEKRQEDVMAAKKEGWR